MLQAAIRIELCLVCIICLDDRLLLVRQLAQLIKGLLQLRAFTAISFGFSCLLLVFAKSHITAAISFLHRFWLAINGIKLVAYLTAQSA